MSLKEVRKKALKKNNDLFSYPFRYISTIITMFLVKTNITPLQVTWAHLIIGIIAAILYSFGSYNLIVIAVILFIVVYILDLVDGEIARYKNAKSEAGGWLDHISDYILLFLMIVGIAIGNFRINRNISTLILALTALLITASNGIINISKRSSEKMKQVKSMKLPIKFKLSKRLHIGIFTISFLILIIGPLTKQVNLMFIIYLIIGSLALIKSFISKYKFLKNMD